MKTWSPKNILTAREVRLGSEKCILFFCCEQEYKDTPVRKLYKGKGCPCCNGGFKLCGRSREECQRCFDKSFASSRMSKFYIKEGQVSAIFVPRYSRKIGKFLCDKGHAYEQPIGVATQGYGCGICKFKGERKMADLFIEHFGKENMKVQFTFGECKNKQVLPFDFLLFDKIIVELDGRQHYEEIPFFADRTLAERQAVDKHKEECAMEQGYHVLRVRGPDFYTEKKNSVPNTLKVIAQLRKIKEPRLVKIYGDVTWD